MITPFCAGGGAGSATGTAAISRARVGVLRVLEHRAARADLDDLAEVHHRHAVADALDHRHVVRDEQVGDARARACRSSSRLTICAWIETSSADTASSAMMTFGLQRQRAGDGDALPLAAGELVRIALRVVGRQADVLAAASATRSCASLPLAMPCT